MYDTTIIFVGGEETGEDHDRKRITLPEEVNEMVSSFGKENRKNGRKTIVVLSIPATVAFPWKDDVDAIICDFYGGEVMAYALFNVIYGKVNPSGKLPISLANTEND